MPLLDNKTQISDLVEGLDHPEGIAWGRDGFAYAGGEAGQVYRIDIEAKTSTKIADTGGFLLGIALDADNNIYALRPLSSARTTPRSMSMATSTSP